MNKTLRWILFIPAFILYASIVESICIIILTKLYDLVFPINGFLGYLGASIGIPILIVIPCFYIAGAFFVLAISPKVRIGASVLLIIVLLSFGLDYYMRFQELSKVRIILDAGIIWSLAYTAIKRPD